MTPVLQKRPRDLDPVCVHLLDSSEMLLQPSWHGSLLRNEVRNLEISYVIMKDNGPFKSCGCMA